MFAHDEDTIENPNYTARIEEATKRIEAYVAIKGERTYGEIARAFVDLCPILTAAIQASQILRYNDDDPAPSRVRLETQEFKDDVARQKGNELGFNNQGREKFDAMLEARKDKSHRTRVGKRLAEMMA